MEEVENAFYLCAKKTPESISFSFLLSFFFSLPFPFLLFSSLLFSCLLRHRLYRKKGRSEGMKMASLELAPLVSWCLRLNFMASFPGNPI